MMTSAQVVKTAVNVTTNSPSEDYTHTDDQTLPPYSVCFGEQGGHEILFCDYSVEGC